MKRQTRPWWNAELRNTVRELRHDWAKLRISELKEGQPKVFGNLGGMNDSKKFGFC